MSDTPFPDSDTHSQYVEMDASYIESTSEPPLTLHPTVKKLFYGLMYAGVFGLATLIIFAFMDDGPEADTIATQFEVEQSNNRDSANDFYTDTPNGYAEALPLVNERIRKRNEIIQESIEKIKNNRGVKDIPENIKDMANKGNELPINRPDTLSKLDSETLLSKCFDIVKTLVNTEESKYCGRYIDAKLSLTDIREHDSPNTEKRSALGNDFVPRDKAGKTSYELKLDEWKAAFEENKKSHDLKSATAGKDDVQKLKDAMNEREPSGVLDKGEIDKLLSNEGLALAAAQDPMVVQNHQKDKQEFLSKNREEDGVVLKQSVMPLVSPYTIMSGTIIPITISSAINSDLPGCALRAYVNQPVYDSIHRKYLLLPQGTTVLGCYDSVVAHGQERLLVVWTRLIRPDGSSILLESMQGVDLSGKVGLSGSVDNHFARLITGVIFSSILSTGVSATQSESQTLSSLFTKSVGESSQHAGDQLLQKNLNIQPTITIPHGTLSNIYVQKDIVLTPFENKK